MDEYLSVLEEITSILEQDYESGIRPQPGQKVKVLMDDHEGVIPSRMCLWNLESAIRTTDGIVVTYEFTGGIH